MPKPLPTMTAADKAAAFAAFLIMLERVRMEGVIG